MSYLTIVPNCYYGNSNQMPQAVNSYIFNQNQSNTLNVLTFLKTALTISLNNYQQNYQQIAIQPQSTPLPTKNNSNTQELSPKALELLQSYEENKEIPHFNIDNQQKVATERDASVKGNMIRKELVVLTEDELLLDDRQKQTKKLQSAKKRGKKVKEDVDGAFVVSIPTVDLIETAYLPLFSMERDELAKKRQELLLRKVGDWNQTLKGKKDKRQIRNLIN